MSPTPLKAGPETDMPPSPPFINVEGVPNFRDCGGYPIPHSSNQSIKRGILHRCGEPSKITENWISKIRELGITHIFDLRSENEIEHGTRKGRGGIREWEGCQRVPVPIFKDRDYSPEALAARFKDFALTPSEGNEANSEAKLIETALQTVFEHLKDVSDGGTEGFMRAYSEIIQHAPPAYRTILQHLANDPSKPLAVHCTAGKDRAGTISAIVLSLCGRDAGRMKKATLARLMENPALLGNIPGTTNMMGAKPASMMAFLKLLRERYGGAEGFVIEKCGLTKEDVVKIRSNLVVEVPPIHQKTQEKL